MARGGPAGELKAAGLPLSCGGAQKRILTGLAAVSGLSAANFSPDADGHGGTLITDPSVGVFTVMRKQFLG